MMITSGMWFSTASIITSCWSIRAGHLHPPRAADGRVGDVAVAADLVGGVDDHHPLLLGQHPGASRSSVVLPTPGLPRQQDALARLERSR
jgi:hypothetical protein